MLSRPPFFNIVEPLVSMGAILAITVCVAAWVLASTHRSEASSRGKTALERELLTALSSPDQLCMSNTTCYKEATTRWLLDWGIPHFDVIVRPTTLEDVETTIRLANKYDKPFLAISGSHGATLSLSKLQNGLGMWMQAFKNVTVHGSTARIGGGITSGELRDELGRHGKQTVTGSCDCTGAVAPMLGGGHGWLQGR